MPVLGCSCTGNAAYFAPMSGDDYVDDPLARIPVADVLDSGERLVELRERVRLELERIAPDGVVLLGSNYQPRSYNEAAERASIETIVRLVAQELRVVCAPLPQATVLARLGLSRTGKFDLKARAFFAEEHPPFWAQRCKAAAAAVAWERV